MECLFEDSQIMREWIGLLCQILTQHMFFWGRRDVGQMDGSLGHVG